MMSKISEMWLTYDVDTEKFDVKKTGFLWEIIFENESQ